MNKFEFIVDENDVVQYGYNDLKPAEVLAVATYILHDLSEQLKCPVKKLLDVVERCINSANSKLGENDDNL